MSGSTPFFRYLMGMMLIEPRGSVLAIGLLHASWNASSSLPAVNGGWQYIAALLVLVVVLVPWRVLRGQSLVKGDVPHDAPEPA